MKNKIEIIEALNDNQLLDLVASLLKKLNYKNVNLIDDTVLAEVDSPLSTHIHGFVVFNQSIFGTDVLSSISEQIKRIKNNANITTVYLVSKFHISKGLKSNVQASTFPVVIDYMDRDTIVRLVDEKIPDYWKHDDLVLLNYEKHYCEIVLMESDLKKLKLFSDKYQKLLDLFIEPNIYHIYEKPDTKTPFRKKVTIEKIIESSKPGVISGSPGSGKSTFLKRVGEQLINKNTIEKRNIPIFISTEEIFINKYSIHIVMIDKLKTIFGEVNIEQFIKTYKITLLIDSLDEFDESNQKVIIKELISLNKKYKINYFLGSRNSEKFTNDFKYDAETYHIEKFNFDQIKTFVGSFFPNSSKADMLLDALKENRIMEKLPITPLTLSLISILYEEKNFEVPATITDIYDNFNSFLLGRPTVMSSLEFIDISFKERILSVYALELLKRKEHKPMTVEEFFNFFEEYYQNKTFPIHKEKLNDFLKYLIDHTGILTSNRNRFIVFNHSSFMEYYGALELFKHQREQENLLIENYFEGNWQNAAIFYAGKSKDMPIFLDKVIERLKSAKIISHFLSGVMGTGYLLQSLYQTDNEKRKEAIYESILLNIKALDVFLKISNDDNFMFRNYKLPIFWLLNVTYFYENFNSITLKEPLKMVFLEAYGKYLETEDQVVGYIALKTAITLSSKRINDNNSLEKLIFESKLTNDTILTLLADFSLEVLGNYDHKQFKKELEKSASKLSKPLNYINNFTAGQLRYSNYDVLQIKKPFQIITEGVTDAEILEHAFMILTKGEVPYWSIKPAGIRSDSGGANEVSKTLHQARPILSENEILIGIFDRDSKGLAEYNGLKSHAFESLQNNTLKKHVEAEIYALCLPLPEHRENYDQKNQSFNFLSIEHYFSDEFLKKHNMLKLTAIPGIEEINSSGSAKSAFSKAVRLEMHSMEFIYFMNLFQYIDSIFHMQIEYYTS